MRIVIMVLLCSFIFPVAALCQPKGIHISWNGKSKVKTSSTMGITWLNDQQGKATVRWGKDSSNLANACKADEAYSEPLKAYVHKATLKKLLPATYYYYRVGSDATGWSPVYKFRTAPETGEKSKIVIGIWSDTQDNKGNYSFEQTDSVVKQMAKNSYYFTMHNGDMVENGSKVNSWKALFNVGEPLNARYPFMSVTGNHDVVNDTASPIFQKPFPVYYDLFNLPNDQLNYSYDYGNAHFVAINSGWAQGAEKVGKVYFQKGSEEYRWLEKDLAKARKNKDIDWIIVYSHYPVYSFGFSHVPTWQAHIKPLVDKYEVDLSLAGHRHVYERHKAVRGSEIFDMSDTHVYDKPKGTIYVTNGSCGGSLQGVGGSQLPTMVFTPKEKKYTYSIMTLNGRKLDYAVYDKEAHQVDHFTINK